MKEENIGNFRGHLTYLNKLSPYKLKYHCSEDCIPSGCPSHVATFTISHATDTFGIDFGDGREIWLDPVKMAMIKDFMNRMEMI